MAWDVESDVVVIGSGIGGLTCAALLAYYGHDVRVCESHYYPGKKKRRNQGGPFDHHHHHHHLTSTYA